MTQFTITLATTLAPLAIAAATGKCAGRRLRRQDRHHLHRQYGGRHLRPDGPAASRAISAATCPAIPSVIAENMPGAGTLRAANYIANVAPKNGTALGIVSETLAIEQALKNAAVQYDAAKLIWVGRVAASNAVHIVWHTSKVQSIEDAKRYEATIAGTGPGNRRRDRADAAQCRDRHQVQDRARLSGGRTNPCWRWSAARSRAPRSTGPR